MNLKTTVTLLVLVAAGAGVFWYLETSRHGAAAASETMAVLEKELQPEKLSRIEIGQGDPHLILERGSGDEWTLPGKWPTRRREVSELIELLTGLRTRFAPESIAGKDLRTFGLDDSQGPVRVAVRTSGGDFRLLLGEKPDASNRFSSPTYLRLDDRQEVIRLAPGLVAMLSRPIDYYQLRGLFPSERVTDSDSQDKVDRLAAKAIGVTGGTGNYGLARAGEDWSLQTPVRDGVDPEKIKTILNSVPDVWAEQFVQNPKKDLAEYGLDKPERTLNVTSEKGGEQTLLIGKKSQTKTRTVIKPPPPQMRGMPPQMAPTQETVHDDYYYAKLKGNDQIFEIKDDKLKNLFVPLDTLRDSQLARFRTFDAQKLEIKQKDHELVFAKENSRWKVQKPFAGDAEESKIDEVLQKLSGLSAKDKDVIDKADAKTHGLDAPAATITVTAEESTGEGEKKTKKTKTFTFNVGKHDAAAKKLYVRVAPWDRVNAVEDSLAKLLERPALAYRGRRVLDVNSSDLARIEVQRGNEKYALEQTKDNWKLTAPEAAEVDGSKVNTMVSDLARLEAVEFVSDAPKPDELEKSYGLSKPAVTATLRFTQKDKPAQTVLLGKQRGDKPEYFAKLENAPAVFVVKKEVYEALDRSALALLPAQPWKLQADEIAEIKMDKGAASFRLKRDGTNWRIAEPFEAGAAADQVQPLIDGLTKLNSERYEAQAVKQLGNYGLDQPYLRIAVTPTAKKDEVPAKDAKDPKDAKEPKEAKEKPKGHVLLVGKPTSEGAKSRFAKLGDGDAVFVVGEKFVADVDKGALDLLDRKILAIDPKNVSTVKSTGKGGTLTLEKKDKDWTVTGPAPAKADRVAVADLLNVWFSLSAERFVDYGPKIDAAKYGFDKPSAAVTVTVTKEATGEQKPGSETQTILLGNPVSEGSGERFARLESHPGVFVLNAGAVGNLTRNYLDYIDRALLNFDGSAVTGLQRKMGSDELELTKRDGSWAIVKPQAMTGDAQSLEEFFQRLGELRAEKVAAYQAKDLIPFGLDAPAAVVTLKVGAAQHVLTLGKDAENGGRYARVDQSPVVAVLPAAVTKQLVAGPLAFRDRTVASFADADRLILQRGPREATFAKVDGTWKLTKPVTGDAEQAELEDFLNACSRLRADEIVAEKPDNKLHGFDKPEARWRFQAGDKEVLELLVGNGEQGVKSQEPGVRSQELGVRRYAKLGKGELVFLLSPKITGQALAEYRQRNVWPSLDAAQVETVRYGNAKPFVLEKRDNTWTTPSKPGMKVNAAAVNETLDALSRLRLERYIVDKGADLKLYGLEPPLLALEVQLPSGKRVLQLGRPEGDSKRYYARLTDDKDNAVFVIAEADAAKIVRELTAFEERAP